MTEHHPPKLYAWGHPDAIGVNVPSPPIAEALINLGKALAPMLESLREAYVQFARAAARARAAQVQRDRLRLLATQTGLTMRQVREDQELAERRLEVYVSGLEGRYYVRGGLDPAYRNRAALDVLVRRTLDGRPEDPDDPTPDLTLSARSRLATAAIRGWVEGHPAG